jgi:hypothetical protein
MSNNRVDILLTVVRFGNLNILLSGGCIQMICGKTVTFNNCILSVYVCPGLKYIIRVLVLTHIEPFVRPF